MSLYAWQVFENDEWNIIALVSDTPTTPISLVTTRESLASMMRSTAMRHAAMSGLPVRLARFELVETIEEFRP